MFFKRLTIYMLIIAMIISFNNYSVSAAKIKPDLYKKAKEIANPPSDYKLKINFINNKKKILFHWYKEEDEFYSYINIEINSDDGDIIAFNQFKRDFLYRNENGFFLKKEEAYPLAFNFLKKVMTSKTDIQYVECIDNIDGISLDTFTFIFLENNSPYTTKEIFISVDKVTGDIRSYSASSTVPLELQDFDFQNSPAHIY